MTWRATTADEIHPAGRRFRFNSTAGTQEVWEDDTTVLQAALDLADSGYPLFPCRNRPGEEDDKAPLTPHGFKDATLDPAQIKAWWKWWPSALVGTPTGELAGYDVLDTDPRHGSDKWLNTVKLPQTLTIKTRSGGEHRFFKHVPGLRCSTDNPAPGVDIRADGGYRIAWECHGYETNGAPLAPWPAELLVHILKHQPALRETERDAADLAAPSAQVVIELLDRLPNPLETGWSEWISVLLAARGCIQGLEAVDRCTPEEAEAIKEAACEWSDRWPAGQDIDVRAKWDDDIEKRDAPLAGWVALQRHAERLIPGYRTEQAMAEFAAVPLPPEPDAAKGPAKQVIGRPFVWRDPHTIPPREWVYGGHFIRRYLTATIAPGALGKSSHAIVEALDMVTGKGLLTGKPTDRRYRVSIWNGEDPLEEIERRAAAACIHYGLTADDIGDRLFLNSGRDAPISMASESRDGLTIATPIRDARLRELTENKIDVLICDPFITTHQVSENDNAKINAVARQFAYIAEKANVAIELIHHTRKGQGGGQDRDVDDARGAKALTDAARSVRVLNVMQAAEADALGIQPERRRRYFRVDDAKANLVPPSEVAVWRSLVSVNLHNQRDGLAADHVGVVQSWTKPAVTAGVDAHLAEFGRRLAAGAPNRKDIRAREWVGNVLADVMGLDVKDATDKRRVQAILKDLIESGVVTTDIGDNGNHRKVEIITGVAEVST